MVDILFDAGEAGLPPAVTPDGMWHRRQLDGWSNISHTTGRPRRPVGLPVENRRRGARNAPGKDEGTDEQDVRGGRGRGRDPRRPGRGAGETRLGEPAHADGRRGLAVAGGRGRRRGEPFLRYQQHTVLPPASERRSGTRWPQGWPSSSSVTAGREGSDTVVQAGHEGSLQCGGVRRDSMLWP